MHTALDRPAALKGLASHFGRKRVGWIGGVPTVEITGGDHVFMIGEVRVVATKRGMICPRCGCGCYGLVFHDGWGVAGAAVPRINSC